MADRPQFRDRTPAGRHIIAVDGEGANLPYSPGVIHPDPRLHAAGWHSYTLLAAADDRGWHNVLRHDGTRREADPAAGLARNYGLRTLDCLEFLLDLPTDADVVSFYFSYDVDKIVADLPLANLTELHSSDPPADASARVDDLVHRFGLSRRLVTGGRLVDKESTVWGKYHISYRPRKQLRITDLAAGRVRRPGETRDEWARRVVVWDVFGFFQSSFVKALNKAKHLFDPEVLDRISKMKALRSEFDTMPADEVEAYCLEECRYLTRLVRDMFVHLDTLGLKLTRIDGSGSVAEAQLRKENTKRYIAVPGAPTCCASDPTPLHLPEQAVLSAYFGGRFEVSDIGHFDRLYAYDVNSAYPAEEARLPCLVCATTRRARGHQPGKLALYLAGSRTTGKYAPFPFRVADPNDDQAAGTQPSIYGEANRVERARSQLAGSVYYAHGGRRWLWSPEVDVAIRHFGADAIPIHDAWVIEPGCDHQPFGFVPAIYRLRAAMKAAGPGSPGYNGAETMLKLVMNSLYGKLAQSVGVSERNGVLHPPPFQCWVWAGLITSGCRARILDAIMQADTVSTATDGILTTEPLDHVLPISDRLGDWDADEVVDAYLFQSGVYTFLRPDCGSCDGSGCKACRVFKTRGFAEAEVPATKLIDTWNAGRFEVPPEPGATRFVRGKAGRLRTDPLNYLGQWVPSRHSVRITHTRRRGHLVDDEWGIPEPAIVDGVYGSEPYVLGDDDLSAPYTPKESWAEVDESRGQEELGDFLEATDEELAELERGE